MKNGWQTTTLGELCRFIDYRGKTPEKTASGLRLITAKNVKMGYLQAKPMEFVAPESYDGWMTRGIPKMGDVLFTTEAPLANVAQLDTEEKVVFAQRIIVLQPSTHNCDRTFLKYLLLSDVAQNRIHGHGTGATVQGIKASLLKTIPIELPTLPEQQRIVGLLDEAFEGIATAKANTEKNLQNARALFESHLQSIFTQHGKGWESNPLERLATIRTGKRDANYQVENGPYPFYTCAFGQFKSPTFSFDGPSIILPGNGANVGKVFFHDGKFEAYQRTYVVNELSQSLNSRFLYFCFSANWPGWIATKQFGSATNYIVVGDLKAFPVPTPSLPVQEATVEELESFKEDTQRLATLYERKLAALDALKKSLLHQAFTGQL